MIYPPHSKGVATGAQGAEDGHSRNDSSSILQGGSTIYSTLYDSEGLGIAVKSDRAMRGSEPKQRHQTSLPESSRSCCQGHEHVVELLESFADISSKRFYFVMESPGRIWLLLALAFLVPEALPLPAAPSGTATEMPQQRSIHVRVHMSTHRIIE